MNQRLIEAFVVLVSTSVLAGFRLQISSNPEKHRNTASDSHSLYPVNSPVLNLNSSSFSPVVFESERAFLIEFYSSWCGHCVDFAPKYESFAADVYPWRSVVTVAAINCADDFNLPLCRNFKVNRFPTIKYFKFKSRSLNDSYSFKSPSQKPELLRQMLATAVVEDATNAGPYPGWPDFGWIGLSDSLDDIRRNISKLGAKHLALLVANSYDDFTTEVLLDLSHFRDVYARRLPREHPLAMSRMLDDTPGILMMSADEKQFKQINGANNRLVMTKAIVSAFKLHHSTITAALRTTTTLASIVEYDFNLSSNDTIDRNKEENSGTYDEAIGSIVPFVQPDLAPLIHMDDLLGSIAYLLGHEVAIQDAMNNTAVDALIDFLDILGRYFPGKPSLTDLLYKSKHFVDQNKGSLDGEMWKVQYDKLQAEHGQPLPTQPNWVVCRGSEARYRGYPCSLWLLFHTITVHAFKISGSDSNFRPLTVLGTIKRYILNFFGCRLCAENFAKEAFFLDKEINENYDVVIWLWRTHNHVNARLHGQSTEDPEHPKVQFPSIAQCSNCRNDEGQWDESQVLEFMLERYGNEKIEGSEKKTEAKIAVVGNGEADEYIDNLDPKAGSDVSRERSRAGRIIQSGFRFDKAASQPNSKIRHGISSDIDFSLCFMLWAGSIVLLALMYGLVRHRRNRHKLYKRFYGDRNV